MVLKNLSSVCLFFCFLSVTLGQVEDSIRLSVPLDSIVQIDTLSIDSLGQDTLVVSLDYNISKDGIDKVVNYGSEDSLVMDNMKRLVHLYGDAYVNYGDLELKAPYIMLDLTTNIALAEGFPDSTGNIAGNPVFKDKAQEFEAGRMRYNFKTRKGLIYDVTTLEGDLHIHGATTKFYGEGGEEGREHHTVYSSDAIFTTCDHDVPHFGIRSRKQKIVPNKVAVIGPSNLEIGGVPTPLYLPFGFFPLKKGKRGGLMFPNNYQYSDRWGFGLENVGYYVPISDHFDVTVLTDFYFRGSYGADVDLRYKKRYKYNGSLKLGYSSFKTEATVPLAEGEGSEIINQRQNSFSINLSHSQSPNAHPYRNLNGSINMEVNRFANLNYNDAQNVLNNSLNSNFTLTQKIAGTPFTATLGISHSQNTKSRQMRMSLPKFDLRMRQINPFKKKRRTGPEKWYEKVSLGYNSSVRYDLSGADTSFFEAQTFQDGKFGIKHNINTNVNFNVLKYFQLSPFVNVTETWYTKEVNKSFADSLTIKIDTVYNDDSTAFVVERDTTSYGDDIIDRNSNFNAIHQYDAGVSLFTKLYGTVRFKKGWLRGIRHTAKPSISLSYSPNYRREELGYFDSYISRQNDGDLDTLTYSKFEGEIFGSPSSGERFSLNYSLTNLFEAKLFSKKDSTFRKAKILDNLNISGNYNFAADSLNWSQIGISGNVRLFKGLAIVKLTGGFDPYALNEDGRRINTFEKDVSGKILRLDNARLSLNTGMTVKQFRELFSKKDDKGNSTSNSKVKTSLISMFDKLRLRYIFTMTTQKRSDNSLHFQPTVHSLAIQGELPLSPKWSLRVGNIDYNFKTKGVSYPDLSLSRDLHCWTMGVGWQPERSTYNFYLRVKPGSLDFIQLPYRRNRADGFDN